MMDFTTFYTAIHGYAPYQWQIDLANKVVADDTWDNAISAPTGAGKTSVIDIAVWHLAHQIMTGTTRTAPLRIVHTVERKLIVDGAAAHAETIARAVDTNPELADVRAALRSLLPDYHDETEPTILVTSMHGDTAWEQTWWRPVGCSIITGTMTQIVSRVLYRGIGESSGTRSLSAAVLGTDAVRFVDEPHLMIPAAHALREQGEMVTHRPPYTVALGATLPASMRTGGAFVADMNGQKTWNRETTVEFVDSTAEATVSKAIAGAAMRLHTDHNGGVVVLVSTTKTARKVAELISKKKIATRVVTSHVRPHDRKNLTVPMPDGIIVATQTLEVGVDYDANAIVTDLAPLPVLVQRAGRAGRKGGHAHVHIVAHNIDGARASVYSQESLDATWQALQEFTNPTEDFANLNIHDPRYADTWVAEPRRVELDEKFVDLLFDTTANAPWEAFLRGPEHDEAKQVTLVWRDEPDLIDEVPATPAESITLSMVSAKTILSGGSNAEASDFESAASSTPIGHTPLPEGTYGVIHGVKTRLKNYRDFQPGMTIALPASAGYYAPHRGLDSTITTPVTDIVADTRQGTENYNGDVTVPLSCYLTPKQVEKYNLGEITVDDISDLLPQGSIISGRTVTIRATNRTTTTTTTRRLGLANHLTQVAAWAEATAAAAETFEPAEHFRTAGLHHDLGKAYPAFQREVLGNITDEPIAKSVTRVSWALPRTLPTPWRHETAISHMLHTAGHTTAAWLVADHHGRGAIHPYDATLVQAVPAPRYGSPWDASALSALFRYADWQASAHPQYNDLTMKDIADDLIDYTTEELLTPPPATPAEGTHIIRLEGLTSSPDGGKLAAHGAYAAVLAEDPQALLRFVNGVAEIATTADSVSWQPLPRFRALQHNRLAENDAAWYTTEYWKQDAKKGKLQPFRIATAVLHNNKAPLSDLMSGETPDTDLLLDPDAGWITTDTETPAFDVPDVSNRVGGFIPYQRRWINSWCLAGQLSWGAAQTKNGVGAGRVDGVDELRIPMPSTWATLAVTTAMARRGVDVRRLTRGAFANSPQQSRWVSGPQG